jgi:hypothetical protein
MKPDKPCNVSSAPLNTPGLDQPTTVVDLLPGERTITSGCRPLFFPDSVLGFNEQSDGKFLRKVHHAR